MTIYKANHKISGKLLAYVSASATSFDVDNPPTNVPTRIVVEKGGANEEYMDVTAVSGNTITVTRGIYNSGVGKEHQQNSTYEEVFDADHINGLVDSYKAEHNDDGTHKIITLDEQSTTPATPASGKGIVYIDSQDKLAKYLLDSGLVYALETNWGFARQAIVNGGFDIWQRGTSLSKTGSQGYIADRFLINGSFDATQQIETGVIDGRFTNVKYLQISPTNAPSSRAAIQYRMEGQDFRVYAKTPFTISFYVKSSKTGKFTLNLSTTDDSYIEKRSFITEFIVNNANVWERKIVSVPVVDDLTGVNLSNEKVGFIITWNFSPKSDDVGSPTLGQWISGVGAYTVSADSSPATNSDTFGIWGVEMNLGKIAQPFYPRSVAEEEALCKRYYEKSYNIDVQPGTNSLLGLYRQASIARTNTIEVSIPMQVAKRKSPTVSTYRYDGTLNRWDYYKDDGTAGDTSVTVRTDITNEKVIALKVGTSATNNSTYVVYGHWVADAEL